MQLKDWIIEVGPKKVAKLLKVEPQTVSNWRVNKGLPRSKVMLKIHTLSKGRVSYKEMVETAARARK